MFKVLYIFIAKGYLKYFPNTNNWDVYSESLISLLLTLNILSIFLIVRIKISPVVLISSVLILHFSIGFLIKSNLNKDLINEFKINRFNKIAVISYMLLSFVFLLIAIYYKPVSS